MGKITIFVLSIASLSLVVRRSSSILGGFSNLPGYLGDDKAVSNLAGTGITYSYSTGSVDLGSENDHEAKEKKRCYWLDHVGESYSDYLEDAKEKAENKKGVDMDDVVKQYASLYKYYTTAEGYLDDSGRKTELLNNYYKTLVSPKKLYDDNADN